MQRSDSGYIPSLWPSSPVRFPDEGISNSITALTLSSPSPPSCPSTDAGPPTPPTIPDDASPQIIRCSDVPLLRTRPRKNVTQALDRFHEHADNIAASASRVSSQPQLARDLCEYEPPVLRLGRIAPRFSDTLHWQGDLTYLYNDLIRHQKIDGHLFRRCTISDSELLFPIIEDRSVVSHCSVSDSPDMPKQVPLIDWSRVTKCEVAGATITQSTVQRSKLIKCRLQTSEIQGECEIRDSRIEMCISEDGSFADCPINDCDMRRATLTRCHVISTRLVDCWLRDCQLIHCSPEGPIYAPPEGLWICTGCRNEKHGHDGKGTVMAPVRPT